MTRPGSEHSFAYNGAPATGDGCVCLDYRDPDSGIAFEIPQLTRALIHIPARYLDLLELACYVCSSDRYVFRGRDSSPHFTGWCRQFRHIMAVRDAPFWSRPEVTNNLQRTLNFLTGDRHEFQFVQAREDKHPYHMFDQEQFLLIPSGDVRVLMFSGGLDSTSGALDVLTNSNAKIILASHASQTGVVSTQNEVVEELRSRFNDRLSHIKFSCHLRGDRAREESQRSRSFLYAAVGAAIAHACGQNRLFFYENGVVSINLPLAEQFKNARASRTTHPKVIHGLSRLLSLVSEKDFRVENPFLWTTKTEVVHLLEDNGGTALLNKTVSCSRTFDSGLSSVHTHCGRCSQCIDRRFAVAAAGLLPAEGRDLYAFDFVTDNICPGKASDRRERAILEGYLGMALKTKRQGPGSFADKWMDEITDVEEGFDDPQPSLVDDLYRLYARHGAQVEEAIVQFRSSYREELLEAPTRPNSLEDVLQNKGYLDDTLPPPLERSDAPAAPVNGLSGRGSGGAGVPGEWDLSGKASSSFISYSHEDVKMIEELIKHLSPLRSQGLLHLWYDKRINAGREFDPEIWKHLEQSDLILLGISSNYMASDSCQREMKRAMERHEAAQATVIPVILHPCDWQAMPFGKLMATPQDGKPVSTFTNQHEAYLNIVRDIKRKLKRAVPGPDKSIPSIDPS